MTFMNAHWCSKFNEISPDLSSLTCEHNRNLFYSFTESLDNIKLRPGFLGETHAVQHKYCVLDLEYYQELTLPSENFFSFDSVSHYFVNKIDNSLSLELQVEAKAIQTQTQLMLVHKASIDALKVI
jgi:hypothetical protein